MSREQSQSVIYSLFGLLFRNLLLKLPRIGESVYSIPSRISWPNILPKGSGFDGFWGYKEGWVPLWVYIASYLGLTGPYQSIGGPQPPKHKSWLRAKWFESELVVQIPPSTSIG